MLGKTRRTRCLVASTFAAAAAAAVAVTTDKAAEGTATREQHTLVGDVSSHTETAMNALAGSWGPSPGELLLLAAMQSSTITDCSFEFPTY